MTRHTAKYPAVLLIIFLPPVPDRRLLGVFQNLPDCLSDLYMAHFSFHIQNNPVVATLGNTSSTSEGIT